MESLASDWGFTPEIIPVAESSTHHALRICAVDLKNEPVTAETFFKFIRCLRVENIDVEVRNIRVSPVKAGLTNTLQDTYVIAKLLGSASNMIQLACSDPPGALRQMFGLPEIDKPATTTRCTNF